MAPPSLITPRRDGLTEAQAQANMGTILQAYYVDDVDGAIDRSDRAPAAAQKPRAKPKKQPPKHTPSPSSRGASSNGSSGSSSSQDDASPSTRKSTRVTKKRSAAQMEGRDEKAEQSPAKKARPSSSSTRASKRAADEHSFIDEGPPAKKAKFQLIGPKKVDEDVTVTQTSEAPAQHESSDADIEDAGEQTESPAGKGKGKAKKTATTSFKGRPSQKGYSIEKPEDAPNDEPWKCANRNCSSGQTWHNRDGPGPSYGRKTISNFFGRNKKETNLIHPDVWHNYCRKDYQRSTYRANIQSAEAKCKYYFDNIQMQLLRIKLWRPEAKFKVQLSAGAEKRSNLYNKAFAKNGSNKAKARQAVEKSTTVNNKGKEKPLSLEDAFPIERLQHFEEHYAAENQGFDDIKEILDWTQDLVDNGHITSMPPMEFLINKQQEGEEIIDPTHNYERWAAYEDGKDFVTPSASDDEESEDVDQVGDDSQATEVNSDGAALEHDENSAAAESDDGAESKIAAPSTPTHTPTKKRKRGDQKATGSASSKKLKASSG